MKRRSWLRLVPLALTGAGALGWLARRHWWVVHRALIRLGLLARPRNYLRNADFRAETNPGVPDGWGTPDAPAELPDNSGVSRLADGAPIAGARVLRLRNPDDGRPLLLQSYNVAYDLAEPRHPLYTFSVYLRSEGGPCAVELAVNLGKPQRIVVDRRWRRHQVADRPRQRPGRIESNLCVQVWVCEAGTVDVAAPQLETGDRATPFRTSLLDERPPKALPWPERDEETQFRPATPLRDDDDRRARRDAAGAGVAVDRVHRTLDVDGVPFLAIGAFVESERDLDLSPRVLADLAIHGFNTLVIGLRVSNEPGRSTTAFDQARRQLGAAREHSLRVLFLMDHENTPFASIVSATTRVVGGLRDHPALLGWILLNEPDSSWEASHGRTRGQIEALYRESKQADPFRPVFITELGWTPGTGGYASLQATDVGSTSEYPAGRYQNPAQAVADRARVLNADSLSAGKPSALWLQLFGGYSSFYREPTPDESRAMAYLAFIRGTRLLLYWKYKPMGSPLWESARAVHAELTRLHERVSRDDARWISVGTRSLKVHFALWEVGDALCLAACNASPEPTRAAFALDRLSGRHVRPPRRWYGAAPLEFADGTVKVSLRGHESLVLECETGRRSQAAGRQCHAAGVPAFDSERSRSEGGPPSAT